jgi:hypothetical protein
LSAFLLLGKQSKEKKSLLNIFTAMVSKQNLTQGLLMVAMTIVKKPVSCPLFEVSCLRPSGSDEGFGFLVQSKNAPADSRLSFQF